MTLDDLWPPASPYLVVPRTFAQSMSEEWQQRLAGLLEQLNEKVDQIETPVRGFIVAAHDEGGGLILDPHMDTKNGERRV